jgi:protein-disulfide isomerase
VGGAKDPAPRDGSAKVQSRSGLRKAQRGGPEPGQNGTRFFHVPIALDVGQSYRRAESLLARARRRAITPSPCAAMSSQGLRIVHVVLALCTVVLTGVVVRREFRTVGPPPPPPPTDTAYVTDEWTAIRQGGHRSGPSDAPVTIVQFSDFECSACRVWNQVVFTELQAEFPGALAFVHRHWPLPFHQHAYPAARASECAADQGRFAEYHDALYRQQAQLGVVRYEAIAAEVGVPDSVTFAACIATTDRHPRIEADKAAALALKGRGTPLLVINGTVYPSGVAVDSLRAVIAQAVADREQESPHK